MGINSGTYWSLHGVRRALRLTLAAMRSDIFDTLAIGNVERRAQHRQALLNRARANAKVGGRDEGQK